MNSIQITSIFPVLDDSNRNSLYHPPGKEVFQLKNSANINENCCEEKLKQEIGNICSISVEETNKLLGYGLLNYEPKDLQTKERLSSLLFSLMSVSKDWNITYHCDQLLRKKEWTPGLIDIIGVFLSWGATPETLDIKPLPTPILHRLLVNKIKSFPPQTQLEKVMNFVAHSKGFDEMELKLLIKILAVCAFDMKLITQRPLIKIGIENCLEAFDGKTWTDSFIAELVKELKFENEYLPNVANICLQVMPKTKRGNDITLSVSFNILKNASIMIPVENNLIEEYKKVEGSDDKDIKWDSKSTIKEIFDLLEISRNLWSTKLCYIYHIVLLIYDMINRLDLKRKDMESLSLIKAELREVLNNKVRFHLAMDNDCLTFHDLMMKIFDEWDLLIRTSHYSFIRSSVE